MSKPIDPEVQATLDAALDQGGALAAKLLEEAIVRQGERASIEHMLAISAAFIHLAQTLNRVAGGPVYAAKVAQSVAKTVTASAKAASSKESLQ